MKIMRLLWEIVFPFDIVWRTPKQQVLRKLAHAQDRQAIMETAQSLKMSRTKSLMASDEVEVLESPSESQARNAPGKRIAA